MYYAIFIIGFAFSLLNRKLLFIILTLVLSLMAFMRYGIGSDYFSYQYLYDRLIPSVFLEYSYGVDPQEIGFRLFGSFVKWLGFSYQEYLIVFATVNIIFVYKICKKYSKNPTLSMFLYFSFYYLTWTFSGLRQGVVLSVGMYYLLKCIEEKKTFKFVIISFFLSLIHSSAWVLLFLFFISKINIKKAHLQILSIVSILISFLPISYFLTKLTWIPFYYRIYPYLNPELSFNIIDFKGILRLFFLIVALYFYDEISKKSDLSKKIINIFIISMSLYFLLQFSELTAERLSIYGMYLDILILANLVYLFKKNITRLIYLYCLFIFCFIYLFKDLIAMGGSFEKINKSSSLITPYVNIFNKDEFHYNSDFYKLID